MRRFCLAFAHRAQLNSELDKLVVADMVTVVETGPVSGGQHRESGTIKARSRTMLFIILA